MLLNKISSIMKVTVRTLDSKNHIFELDNEEITIKEFKEHICPEVNIPIDKQRIIFRGKVLQDDKKLKEYGVDNCVVHLVQRAPPQSTSSPRSSTGASSSSVPTTAGPGPNVNVDELNGVAQHIVESLVSQFGVGNVSANQNGNSLNVNINVTQPSLGENDVLQRLSTAHRFLDHAEHLLQHIGQPPGGSLPSGGDQATDSSETPIEVDPSPQVSASSTADGPNTEDGPEDGHGHTCDEHSSQTSTAHARDLDTSSQSLGAVLDQFLQFYQELLPSLERYRDLLNDPNSTERNPSDDFLSPQTSEIFHDFAHAFHAMSDLTYNFTGSEPRRLMCYPQMSPVRMAPPMPHVHMSTRPPTGATGRNDQSTTSTSSTSGTATTGQPGSRPVAVAAISTVVHIPAGQFSSMINNSSTRGSGGTTLSSTTDRSSSALTNSGTTTTSTPPSSTSVPNTGTTPQQMFQSMMGGGNFDSVSMPGGNSLPFPMFPPGLFNMAPGNQQPQSHTATQTSAPNFTSTSTDPGGAQFTGALQNMMQNIVQNITSGNISSSSTNSSSSTGTAPSSVSYSTTAGSNTPHQNLHHHVHHQMQHHPRHPHPHQHVHRMHIGPHGSHGHSQHHQHPHHHPGQERTINQPSQSSSSNSSTTTSTSQSSRSTQYRPHPHHHHHNRDGSVIHPDSLLPCQSFHFGPTFHDGNGGRRPQVVAEVSSIVISQRDPQNGANRTDQSSVTTSAGNTRNADGGNQGGAHQDVIANLLSNLTNEPGGAGEQPDGVSIHFEAEDDMDIDNEAGTGPNVMRNFQSMFTNLIGSQLLGGAGGGSAGATNAGNPTLREFVQNHFGVSDSNSGDFLSEFIDVLADNLTMPDLISLFLGGSTQPYARLHPHVKKLLEKHYNNNQTMTESNIPQMVNRIADDVSEITREIQRNLTVRNDVDLNASLRKIDIEHFGRLLRLTLNDAQTFSNGLTEWYSNYLAWTMAMLDYAVTGGTDEYMNTLFQSASLQRILVDMNNQGLQQLTLQTMRGRMRSIAAARPVTQEQLNAIIVRPSTRPAVQREKPESSDSCQRAAKRVRKDEDEVNVDELWEEKYPGGEPGEDSDGDTAPSPEDWHSRVPNDWVVVINRDLERQRRQAPQRPYSDAYLSGLPKKRRKLLTKHSTESDRIDVTTSLSKAIGEADAEQKEQELKDDIVNSDLQSMFEATFRHDVRQRLQSDEDYHPKQHPNSEKYFMNGKDKDDQ